MRRTQLEEEGLVFGGSNSQRIQLLEDPTWRRIWLPEEDLALREGSGAQRIQLLEDPVLEGSSYRRRIGHSEDAILGGPSCQQIQLWEHLALGGGSSALPTDAVPAPWLGCPVFGAALSCCSEARAPGVGRGSRPCRAPPRPSRPDLAAPANAQPGSAWLGPGAAGSTGSARMRRARRAMASPCRNIWEHPRSPRDFPLGIPAELCGAPPCIPPVLPQLLF